MSTATGYRFKGKLPFISKRILKHFPSHMKAGMRKIQNLLEEMDCVLEVHDARIPFTGRNPLFKNPSAFRSHILLLNKMDLVDSKYYPKIVEQLKREGVNDVLFTDGSKDVHVSVKKCIVPAVEQLIMKSPQYLENDRDEFNTIIAGIPNVGKSSLLNAIRRIHLDNWTDVTKVGPTPGITKGVMNKIRVSQSPLIYMVDTPGIIHTQIDDFEGGLKLALCGNLQDHLIGEALIVEYMLYWLNKHGKFRYVKQFDLDEPTEKVEELLGAVCKQRRLIVRRRTMTGEFEILPHFRQAAQIVLQHFRVGKLGRFLLDVDLLEA